MLHLLGIFFIIGGMTGLGLHYLEKERQRISIMEKWEYIIELYISEITYKKQPLSMASIEIGKKVSGPEGEILVSIGEKAGNGLEDSFSEVWKKEWKKQLGNFSLRREEKSMILDFSAFTGFENEKVQRKLIETQQEKWKTLRERVQEESREKKKVILLLSFSAGVLIVLLLL